MREILPMPGTLGQGRTLPEAASQGRLSAQAVKDERPERTPR